MKGTMLISGTLRAGLVLLGLELIPNKFLMKLSATHKPTRRGTKGVPRIQNVRSVINKATEGKEIIWDR